MKPMVQCCNNYTKNGPGKSAANPIIVDIVLQQFECERADREKASCICEEEGAFDHQVATNATFFLRLLSLVPLPFLVDVTTTNGK